MVHLSLSCMYFSMYSVVLQSDAAPTIILLLGFVRVLFESCFRKPVDINNSWIRYKRVMQWRLLDGVISMCSPSVLLPAMEKNCTTWTALALVCWSLSEIIRIRVRVPCILAVATVQELHLFCSELLVPWLLFKGGNYSKAASIQRNTVCVKY